MTHDVIIANAARTPIGSFNSALALVSAAELGTIAIQQALTRANVPAEEVSEVILGNVLTAGLGQNPARQASINAGLPDVVPAYTINHVCGSGLKRSVWLLRPSAPATAALWLLAARRA